MHKLLQDLLKNRGLNSIDELTQEEKQDFEIWNKSLEKDELTISDIKGFCRMQCGIIKNKWSSYDVSEKSKAELIPYFTVYNSILMAIDSPKHNKLATEKHLENLINNK